MKFTNYLLVLIAVFSPIINTQANTYKVMVMGDQGHMAYFYDRQFKTKGATKEQVDEWYSKNLLAEKYEFKDLKCKVTTNGKSVDLVADQGLVNFNNILKNTEVKKLIVQADSIAFLGDMVYPETKFLTYANADKSVFTLPNIPRWLERLECGWNIFFNSLRDAGLVKFAGVQAQLDTSVEILAGNHSFDIDVRKEEELFTKLGEFVNPKPKNFVKTDAYVGSATKDKRIFTKYPKFITIVAGLTTVQFLDFNSSAISCINKPTEADYVKCNKFNVSSISFKESQEYYTRLLEGISVRFTIDATKTVWRAMRAHHPPVNSEDGDADFYFEDVIINGKTYNLMSAMKARKVNLFFGSHIHNAQVMTYNYNRVYAKRNPDFKDEPKGFGCVESPANFSGAPVYKATCSPSFTYDLPLDKANAGLLYVFINGNTGRAFDPLKVGRLTNGYVVWARAVQKPSKKENYGFSFATFGKDDLKVEFYEIDGDSNALVKAATFTVKQGKLPDLKVVDESVNSLFGKTAPLRRKMK